MEGVLHGGAAQLFRQMGHIVDKLPAEGTILRLQDTDAGIAEHLSLTQALDAPKFHSGVQVLDNAAVGGVRPGLEED